MDQTESQIGSGDETSSQRPSTAASVRKTATKPVTKPISSARLSNLAKPKEPLTTKPTTTSSLNRPPSRLTAPARKPAATTAPSSTTTLNKKRNSVVSIDSKTSGDEAKRDGISARPKRLSMASSTSTVVPPAIKRTPTTTSTTFRTESKSPTATRTVTRTPASVRPSITRPASKPAVPQTRPVTTQRSVSSIADKKRLSTIQGSPVVRSVRDKTSKDAGLTSGDEKGRTLRSKARPMLGTRQSTRSLLMKQQLHEFGLVNQMLQAAMLADGADTEEQEALEEQAAETMSKLRATLAKIRYFEKQHGRVPSEAELAEISSEDIDLEISDSQFSASASVSGDHTLRDELSESRAYAAQLEYQIEDMTGKLKEMGDGTEAEGEKSSEADDAFRTEHANKMREMSSANQARLDHLRAIHREELEELRMQHEQALEEVQKSHSTLIAEKDEQLKNANSELGAIESNKNNNTRGEQELDALKNEITVLNTKLAESEANALELEVVKADLEDARRQSQEVADKNREISKLQAKLQSLEAKVESQSSATASRHISQDEADKQVTELQKEMANMQTRHQAVNEDLKSRAAKVEEEHAMRLAEAVKDRDRALADVRNQLKNSQTESRKTEAELQDMKSLQQKNVEILEKERKESASVLEDLRTEHAALLEKVQLELQTTKTELVQATDSAGRVENDKINTLSAELSKVQKELVDAQSKREQQVSELQQRLDATLTAQNTVDTDLQSKLSVAEQAAEDALQRHENLKTDLEIQLGTVKKQLLDTEKNLSQAKSDHADAMKLLADGHEEKISSLKASYSEQMKHLENEGKATLATFDEIEQENHARVAELQSQAIAEKEAALQEQSNVHSSALQKLKSELLSLREQVATAKSNHQSELENVKSKHVLDKDFALKALNEEHSKKISQLEESSTAASTNEIQSLKETHAQAINQLETENRNLMSQISGAQFQLQTMKGVLASTEAESRAKEEEHAEALQQVESQFSQAVIRISNHSHQLIAKDIEHTAALENVRTEMQKEHDEALEKLKLDHSNALHKLKSDLEREATNLREALQTEHTQMLERLKGDVATKDADIQKLKSNHSEVLDQLHSKAKAATQEATDNMQLEHSKQLDALRAELEASHQTALISAESDFQAILEKQTEHASTLAESLRAEHQEAVSKLSAELENAKAKAADSTALDKAHSDLANLRITLQTTREEHDKVLKSVDTSHQEAVARLEIQVADLTADVDQAKSEGTSEIQKWKNLNTEATKVNDVLQNNLSSLKKSRADLEQQCALLSKEKLRYEQQMKEAEAEIRDLRRSAAVASPAISTPVLKPNADTQGKNTKSSPKTGLSSSRWANDDSTEEKENVTPALSPNGSGHSNGHYTERSKTSSSRNVHGQLAGINEDIRSLHDLSEQMLAENQRMAKTLSRVDEETGVITMGEVSEH